MGATVDQPPAKERRCQRAGDEPVKLPLAVGADGRNVITFFNVEAGHSRSFQFAGSPGRPLPDDAPEDARAQYSTSVVKPHSTSPAAPPARSRDLHLPRGSCMLSTIPRNRHRSSN